MIVAAIGAQFSNPPFPGEVVIEPRESGLSKPSAVIVSQLRSVDRQRLAKKLGKLSGQTMRRLDDLEAPPFGFTNIFASISNRINSVQNR